MQRRGKKICVLDQNVSSFLGLITEVSLLREHGVDQCASTDANLLEQRCLGVTSKSTRAYGSVAVDVPSAAPIRRRLSAVDWIEGQRRLLHLGDEPLGTPGVRSVLYFARPTAVNAQLIARQIKASHR